MCENFTIAIHLENELCMFSLLLIIIEFREQFEDWFKPKMECKCHDSLPRNETRERLLLFFSRKSTFAVRCNVSNVEDAILES